MGLLARLRDSFSSAMSGASSGTEGAGDDAYNADRDEHPQRVRGEAGSRPEDGARKKGKKATPPSSPVRRMSLDNASDSGEVHDAVDTEAPPRVACQACTFLNEPGADICEVCNEPLKEGTQQGTQHDIMATQPPPADWSNFPTRARDDDDDDDDDAAAAAPADDDGDDEGDDDDVQSSSGASTPNPSRQRGL